MKRKLLESSNGFTLVELMITVFLTAIAVIAMYRGYTSFSQSADAQQQVIEMQQNLRIGMYTLVKDIMRAGMKEEDETLVAFVNAGADTVEFVMDLGSGGDFADDGIDNDRDGATDEEDEVRIGDEDVDDDGERIRYTLNAEDLEREIWDATSPPGYDPAQTIITNVSALNFVYLDEDENPTAVLQDIDTVEITMVVRTTNEDLRINNDETYANQLGTWSWKAPGDHFRRRAMSMRVKVRNAQL